MKAKQALKFIIAVLISSFFVETKPIAAPSTTPTLESVGTTTTQGQSGTATSSNKVIAEFHATASGDTTGEGGKGLSFGYTDLNGNQSTYSNGGLQVNFAGQEYPAYCLDPGLTMPTGNLTCKAINRSPQINSLVQYAGSTGSDAQTTQLAYRIWAAITGWTQEYDADFDEKTQHAFKETVALYNDLINGDAGRQELAMDQLKDSGFCKTGNCSSPADAAASMFGTDSTTFQNAFDIAFEAKEQGSYKYDQLEQTQGGVSMEIVSEDGRSITYKLTSPYKIPEDQMQIDCVGCDIKTTKAWNGNSAEITVTLPEGGCEAALDMYYETQGSYECSTNSPGTQTLYTYVNQSSPEAIQSVDIALFNLEGCSECCTEATPGKSVSVNNCCYDGTESEVREPELNSLFCKDEKLNLEYFFEKCGADPYMKEINDFCKIWCTERVYVETPGSTTATSGRYFILNPTEKHNTKSPYVLGVKRCRVKVDLETWFSKYEAMLKQQKGAFDKYQENGAAEKMLKEMTEGTISLTSKVTCTRNSTPNPCEDEWDLARDEETGEILRDIYCDTVERTYNYNGTVHVYQLGKVEDYHNAFISGELDNEKNPRAFDNIYMWLSYGKEKLSHFVINETGYSGIAATSNSVPLSDNMKIMDYDDYSDYVTAKNTYANNLTTSLNNSGTCYVVATCEREKADGTIETRRFTKDGKRYCSSALDEKIKEYKMFSMEVYKEILPNKLQHYQNRYSAAAAAGKKLEDDIDMCTHYFERVDPNSLYKFSASAQLSYTQSYLDDKADLKTDTIQIPFESTPGCSVSMGGTSGDGEIMDPQYADKYTKQQTAKEAKLSDMRDATLYWFENRDSAAFDATFRDPEYILDKKSTHDGKIIAECSWDEKPNTVYTLAQSGALEKETMPTKNFTIHNRQYEVHLSTLEGKYETMWQMKGMGENGKFDGDFLRAGTSCSANDPVKVGMFTCAVEVEHEVVLTGYCNGQGAHGVQNGISNCEPFKEGFELINFKVVDPSDLFPAFNDPSVTPSYNGEQYGHNWVQDKEGKEVLGAIQATGQADETYAPKNLSYSFTLAPQDMQEIKDYNESRIGEGGYTDFELVCKCPDGPISHDSKASCNQCISTFLTNLASGSLGGANENSGWSNERESLGTVRGKNHWSKEN